MHVLSMPPAFALSQDQTLRFITVRPKPNHNKQRVTLTSNSTNHKASPFETSVKTHIKRYTNKLRSSTDNRQSIKPEPESPSQKNTPSAYPSLSHILLSKTNRARETSRNSRPRQDHSASVNQLLYPFVSHRQSLHMKLPNTLETQHITRFTTPKSHKKSQKNSLLNLLQNGHAGRGA